MAPQASDEAAVELSPFIVDSSKDRGYESGDTLSGTRLSTATKYVAAAVTDITPELMKDLGLTNMQDLISYGPNSSAYNGGGISTDNTSNQGLFQVNYMIRGIIISTVGRDFMNFRVVDDAYNVERFSFSRGPNAILFGIGNPGGIVNSVSKRAVMKDSYQLTLRGDTNGSRRANIDLNKELIKKKLAIRIAALTEDAMTNRHPSDRKANRLYGSATIAPFATTTISVSGEQGRLDSLNVRPWAAADGISQWIASGQQEIPSNLADGRVNYGVNGGVVPAGSPSKAVNTAQLTAAGFDIQSPGPVPLAMFNGAAMPWLTQSGLASKKWTLI